MDKERLEDVATRIAPVASIFVDAAKNGLTLSAMDCELIAKGLLIAAENVLDLREKPPARREWAP